MLYLHTPMAQALLKMFGNLGDRIAELKIPPGQVTAYVFGGCAVHLYNRARVSTDVDAEVTSPTPQRQEVLWVLRNLPPIDYDDPEEGPSQLSYDPTFNTTLGPLHEDYQDRAVLVDGTSSSPIIVMVPGREDLALSKLGRLAEVDVEDIVSLLSQPEASWELFERLAQEASKYYVGPNLTGNLDYVRRKLVQRGVL